MAASLFQAIVLLLVFVLNDKVRRLYKKFFKCGDKGLMASSKSTSGLDSSGTRMTKVVRMTDISHESSPPAPPKDESSQLQVKHHVEHEKKTARFTVILQNNKETNKQTNTHTHT